MDAAAIRELFARHDLRWTKQREDVYGALMASEIHPTAEEVFNLVRPGEVAADDGGMSLATVYNSLEALVRSGLVRRFSVTGVGGAMLRYDADTSDHAHLVTADGGVRDIPPDLGRQAVESIPRELVERIERRLGVSIRRTTIEFVQRRDGAAGA